MSRLATISRHCVSDGIPRRSLFVAIVVGTILNVIHQGDALIGDGAVNWAKAGLTFVVPYCVATYGAVSFRIGMAPPNERARGSR